MKGDVKMKKLYRYFFLAIVCIGLVGCTNSKMVDRDTAEKTALEQIDGEVVDYKERFDDKEPHHLFDIVKDGKHYEVKVHRETGDIISHNVLDDNEGLEPTTSDSNESTGALLTEEQAKEIALEKVGGGKVVECEYKTEEGKTYYDIEIEYNNKVHEVKVDAKNKDIIESKEHIID